MTTKPGMLTVQRLVTSAYIAERMRRDNALIVRLEKENSQLRSTAGLLKGRLVLMKRQIDRLTGARG